VAVSSSAPPPAPSPSSAPDDGDLGDIAAFWGGTAASLSADSTAATTSAATTLAAGSAAGAAVVSVGGGRPIAVTRPDALLDQLDPPPLAHGGRSMVEVLRPAYLALPGE